MTANSYCLLMWSDMVVIVYFEYAEAFNLILERSPTALNISTLQIDLTEPNDCQSDT